MSRAYKQMIREIQESTSFPEEPASRVRVRRAVDLSSTQGRWSSRDYLEGIEAGIMTVVGVAIGAGAIWAFAWILGLTQ